MEAGRYARQRYRDARWARIREDWRDAAKILALTALMVVAGAIFGGTVRVLAAMLFGFTAAVFVFVWLIGDVRALPWLWGAIGEEATARELEKLDAKHWDVAHDVQRPSGGNWDHIVSSRGRSFVLETKHLAVGTVTVEGDRLVCGRTRLHGTRARGAALELKQTRNLSGWVQAVVVIWGDFPQRLVERERVVYLRGEDLAQWLEKRARVVVR